MTVYRCPTCGQSVATGVRLKVPPICYAAHPVNQRRSTDRIMRPVEAVTS